MIALYAIVSGYLGIRLRTHCRIRHKHKCVSICKDSHAVLCPLQGRNTQSTNRRFVRWVYFALKRRGLAREVRLLVFVPSHCFLLNDIYRSVPRSRHTHQREKSTIGNPDAFPPYQDTPAVPFPVLPQLVQSYILYMNPVLS